ncbi:MAG: class II glutamine amidotransferase [Planctomycetes bacterium]|nr:class II glutamine amidotransferase [Planctomycetota bacterium]MCB9905899.1 class II glutamine amidotransferase [Planctomycetota bacterium]
MCRWMAYTGNSVPIETLLFEAQHNLIDQSMSSRSAATPTNGDGFGLGWYGNRERPGLFRSIRPAWNDMNLRDLAAQLESRLFLAHVRATSRANVQETNCHPFRHGKWLFVHNGEVVGIEKIRRDCLLELDPVLLEEVQGTTDSELMFYLALTFGLETDPLGALARMVAFVEDAARSRGVQHAVWMTLGLSDGESIWAVRYASDGKAPTLYHSRDMKDLAELHPKMSHLFGADARAVVSEPIGKLAEAWEQVPQGAALHVRGAQLALHDFAPED